MRKYRQIDFWGEGIFMNFFGSTGQRRAMHFLGALLLLTIVVWSKPAFATFPWTYTWGTPIGTSTGCGYEAGDYGNLCVDAQSVFNNIGIHFYGSSYAYV